MCDLLTFYVMGNMGMKFWSYQEHSTISAASGKRSRLGPWEMLQEFLPCGLQWWISIMGILQDSSNKKYLQRYGLRNAIELDSMSSHKAGFKLYDWIWHLSIMEQEWPVIHDTSMSVYVMENGMLSRILDHQQLSLYSWP
jgi:hypothetical protein